MKLNLARIVFLFVLLLGLLTVAPSAHAVVGACSWNGSVDANWSTPGNWGAGCTGAGGIPGAGDTLTFPVGGSNVIMTNDLPAITLQALNFTGAQNYTLNGANAITLTVGIDVTGGNQTINAPLTVGGAGVAFHAANGTNLAIGGALNLGANDVSFTVDSASNVVGMKTLGAINGSGAAKISKYGTGELQITGDQSLKIFDIDIHAGSVGTDPAAFTGLPNFGKIAIASGAALYTRSGAVIGAISGAGDIHASSWFQIRQLQTTTFTGDIFGNQQMAVVGNGSDTLTIDRSGGSLSYAGEINANASSKLRIVNTTAPSVPDFLASQGSLELNNSHVGVILVGFSAGAFNYDGALILSGTTPSVASSVTLRNNSTVTSVINSATDYGRINVASPVDLGTGAPILALQGSYLPASGEVFTIIMNTNSGTATKTNAAFSNLAQGGSLPFNTINMVADYQAAGNTALALTVTTPDVTPPTALSIVRNDANPTSSQTVVFNATFSEPVTGVDTADFIPFVTGISGAYVSSVQPSSTSVYWVHVNTGAGNGTLRLDVPAGATISDMASNPIAGLPYTGGETYTVYKNGAPTDITLSNASVSENQPTGTTVGSLTTTDPDPSDTHTYSFTCSVPGVNDSSFQISGSTLQTAAAFNYEVKNSYSICLRTNDGKGGIFDKNFTVTVTDLPGLELLSPANGLSLPIVRPTFDWDDLTGATNYQIQVSKNASFPNTQLAISKTLALSTYAHTGNLPANTLYYWRVRAKVGGVWGAWSATWSFSTGNPPTAPALVAPANNALVNGPSPLFDWKDSSVSGGAVFGYYQIQVATDAAFTTILHNHNIAGIANSSDNDIVLNPAATYYWRVRSVAADGDYSAWSSMYSVRIKILAPTLVSPADLSVAPTLKPTFMWNTAAGASGYTIQISKSLAFGFGTISANPVGISFTPGSNLAAGTKYYWRVRANGAYGPSDWSIIFSFTTP